MYEMDHLVDDSTHRPTSACAQLLSFASLLQGLRCRGPVASSGGGFPRRAVEARQGAPLFSYQFSSGRRNVQVLVTNGRNVRTRFFPAAPGRLWVIPHSDRPSEARPHFGLAPIELVVGPYPVLYEELEPEEARVEPADLVQVPVDRPHLPKPLSTRVPGARK